VSLTLTTSARVTSGCPAHFLCFSRLGCGGPHVVVRRTQAPNGPRRTRYPLGRWGKGLGAVRLRVAVRRRGRALHEAMRPCGCLACCGTPRCCPLAASMAQQTVCGQQYIGLKARQMLWLYHGTGQYHMPVYIRDVGQRLPALINVRRQASQ
jgi:hypothetical protein